MSARGLTARADSTRLAVLLRGLPMACSLAKRRHLTVRARDDVTRGGDYVPPQLETHRLRRARRVSGDPVGGDMLDRIFEDGVLCAVGVVGVEHPVGVYEFGPQHEHQ